MCCRGGQSYGALEEGGGQEGKGGWRRISAICCGAAAVTLLVVLSSLAPGTAVPGRVRAMEEQGRPIEDAVHRLLMSKKGIYHTQDLALTTTRLAAVDVKVLPCLPTIVFPPPPSFSR